MENEEVLEFIKRRFPTDNHWMDGNCFYFATILEKRFQGRILYDVISGHIVTEIDGVKYDWNGVVTEKSEYVRWDTFDLYDSVQRARIIRDCIE